MAIAEDKLSVKLGNCSKSSYAYVFQVSKELLEQMSHPGDETKSMLLALGVDSTEAHTIIKSIMLSSQSQSEPPVLDLLSNSVVHKMVDFKSRQADVIDVAQSISPSPTICNHISLELQSMHSMHSMNSSSKKEIKKNGCLPCFLKMLKFCSSTSQKPDQHVSC
jgi:hypothetical protein